MTPHPVEGAAGAGIQNRERDNFVIPAPRPQARNTDDRDPAPRGFDAGRYSILATHVFGSARSVDDPRRQRQAAHLHSLGPRPTLEAFLEVVDGRDLDDVLGRYAWLAAYLSGSGQAEAARHLSEMLGIHHD